MTPLKRILVGLCGAFAGVAALFAIAPETTRPYLQSLKGDPCFLLSDDEADATDAPIQFAFGSYSFSIPRQNFTMSSTATPHMRCEFVKKVQNRGYFSASLEYRAQESKTEPVQRTPETRERTIELNSVRLIERDHAVRAAARRAAGDGDVLADGMLHQQVSQIGRERYLTHYIIDGNDLLYGECNIGRNSPLCTGYIEYPDLGISIKFMFHENLSDELDRLVVYVRRSICTWMTSV